MFGSTPISHRGYREVGGTSDAPLFTLDTSQPMDGDVSCVCLHPTNGRLLISAGEDGVAKNELV
jgi:WD40 repeat protein